MHGSAEARVELESLVPALEVIASGGGVDAVEAAYVLGGAEMNVLDSDVRALAWFERAGDHAGALRTRGFLAQHGRDGGAPDLVRAAQLYERAAVLGDVVAELNIGLCYLDGSGVSLDAATALRWLEAAAEHGKANARGYAARACELLGDQAAAARDFVHAARWYFRMLVHGRADGIHAIHGFVAELTDAEVLHAAELAGDRSLGTTALSAWRGSGG
jgi:hypothetical protein|nr:hypothetical protein [Kofleriaceae bacterium]